MAIYYKGKKVGFTKVVEDKASKATVKGMADGTLTEFSAPKYGITELAEYRFNTFKNLTKLDLTGITKIPSYTAYNASNLAELILDENITEVGDYAFVGNSKITPINIVANNLVTGNYSLENTKIDSLTGILSNTGTAAFRNVGLKTLNVTINGSLGSSSFQTNWNLITLNVNKDSNITYLGPSAFGSVGVNVRQDNPEYWDLDFRNSTFTSIRPGCFEGIPTAKIKNIRFQFSEKVSSISTYVFRYSDGFKIYWNSVPTLSNTNAFDNATNYKNYFPYDLVHTAKTSTNWSSSSIVDTLYGYAAGSTFGVGETLPSIDSEGYALTWYSDEDLTQEVSTVTDENATYYCNVGERLYIKLSLTQYQANVVVSDGENTYTDGSFVPVNTALTITAVGEGENTQKYIFTLNNNDITSGNTYTTGAVDINIVCIYYDGVTIPVNPTFSENTPPQIKIAVENGLHRALWNIGDEISINLTDGREMTLRYIDQQKNRYEKVNGTGSSNAVFELNPLIATAQMNSTATNNGGWASSLLSTTTIETYYDLLPDDWKAIFSEVKIPSATSGTDSTIVYANNKAFIESGQEIFGTHHLNSYYYDEGCARFDWYSTHTLSSDRIKQYNNSNASWWLRSPYLGDSNQFCYVNSNGGLYSYSAGNSWGVSVCLCI